MIGKMTETMFGLWLSAGDGLRKSDGELISECEAERIRNQNKRFLYMDRLEKCDNCALSVVVNEDVCGHIEHPCDGAGNSKIFGHLPAVRDEAARLIDQYGSEGRMLDMEAMSAFREFVMWLEDEWCLISKANDFQTVATWLSLK